MSSPGRGRPVDKLDKHCHQYKQCQLCARRIHGPKCIGERVKYSMDLVKQDKLYQCRDTPGSCERLLCECDKQFAEGLSTAMTSYIDDFHIFYTQTNFDPTTGNNYILSHIGLTLCLRLPDQ